MTAENKKTRRILSLCLTAALAAAFFSSGALEAAAVYEPLTLKIGDFTQRARLSGGSGGEQLGSDVLLVDLNADGFTDVIASSTFFSGAEQTWRGKTGIYWGPHYRDREKTEIIGENKNDQLGTALAQGDLNGDGYADLAISAYQADYKDAKKAGKVYVFFGGPLWPIAQTRSAAEADIVFHGEENEERLGLALTSGDINGDKVADLLISAPGGRDQQARVYIILGGNYFPPNHRYDVKRDALIIVYGTKNELFGSDLAVGDYDGDGVGDLAIGAYAASTEGKEQNGKVYSIPGRKITATRDASAKYEYNLLEYPQIARVFSGKQNQEWFGFSTMGKNLNGDKYDDLVVGSFMYLYQEKTGKVSVFQGHREFFSDKDPKPQNQIVGEGGQNLLGAAAAFADLNGDDNPELILGAPGVALEGDAAPGTLYVLPEFNLAGDGGFEIGRDIAHSNISSVENDDWFGASVAAADLNKDGMADLVIGAPYADGGKGQNNGAVYVLWGQADLSFRPLPSVSSSASMTRGEAIAAILKSLRLEEKEAAFLDQCQKELSFCLFTFSVQSSYQALSLGELDLYPDLPKEHAHYDAIIKATMLDLVQGYFNENNSPFRPDASLQRIHALKIVLGAMGELEWKYPFELKKIYAGGVSDRPAAFTDVDLADPQMWWYHRYLNRALEIGLIEGGGEFRPHADISRAEMEKLLANAQAATLRSAAF